MPEGYLVGKVLSVDDGGKLKVCSIDVGAEAPVTVVTNATNIAERTIGKVHSAYASWRVRLPGPYHMNSSAIHLPSSCAWPR